MYTADCKDTNCLKCKQALKGQTSGDEVHSEFAKTVEKLISRELLLASKDKVSCLETYKKLKDEVHSKINGLIDILREREQYLCNLLEQEYATQVTKIDHDVTAKCINKLLKKNNEHEKTLGKIQLVFLSDFDVQKRELQHFGCLSYKHISEPIKSELLKEHETWVNSEKSERILAQETTLGSDDLFEVDFKTTSSAEQISPLIFTNSKATPISAENEETILVGKIIKDKKECPNLPELKSKDEGSSDEDDIEFINSNEASEFPPALSFIPPLPSKNKFRFLKKRSCFASFLPKRKAISSEKDSKSESSGFGENDYDGCSVASKSSVSSGSNSENASVNEREFCSSTTFNKGQDNNPSSALLTSFMKYLEKSPESEWLATEKSSEQWLSNENNCISYKPFVVKKDTDLHEWLSKKNVMINSDWLSCNRTTMTA